MPLLRRMEIRFGQSGPLSTLRITCVHCGRRQMPHKMHLLYLQPSSRGHRRRHRPQHDSLRRRSVPPSSSRGMSDVWQCSVCKNRNDPKNNGNAYVGKCLNCSKVRIIDQESYRRDCERDASRKAQSLAFRGRLVSALLD